MMEESARLSPSRARSARRPALSALLWCSLAGCVTQTLPADQSLEQAAEAAMRREDWDTAAGYWRRAMVESGDRDARPYREAARSLLELHEVEEAQRILDDAIERFPDDVDLRLTRGRLLCERGYRRAAEEDFEAVVTLDPSHSEAWLLLAGVQLDLDLPANAAVAVHRYIELKGADDRALYLLGRICAKSGELGEAMSSFERALAGPDVPTDKLVDAATTVTDPRFQPCTDEVLARACEWTNRALARDPQNAEASYVKGMILELRGDDAGAVEAYERAVELVDHLLAMTRLAQVYARMGNTDGADKMIDRALQLNVHASHRRMLERIRRTWH